MQDKRRNAPRGPMGRMRFEKPKNFKKSIKKLIFYLQEYWLLIIIALIFAILGTTSTIVGPKILKNMTEEVIKGLMPGTSINFEVITTIGIILIILYVLSFIFSLIKNFIMAKINAKITKKLRTQISDKINELPLKYFDKHSYGDVLSRVTNDVDTIGITLNQSLSNMITSVTMVVGILIMMLTISWQLTLVNIITLPLTIFSVSLIVKGSQKYFKKQQSSLGEINGHIEEIYSAHNIVKVFNGEQKALNKFDNINEELYKSAYKSQFLSGIMMPITRFVGNLNYVFICVIGGTIALDDPLFIASIVAFVTYVRLFNQPLSQIATITNTLQSTAAAAERVFEFLDEVPEANEDHKTKTLSNIKGNVEFKNVSFGYDDTEVIHSFNCSITAGQKIAIVGPTGAGKTTIVNLLMRFYDINNGQILIDGVSINDMKRGYVRSLFGMVLQDTWLFNGTIRDNLAFGNANASDEEIINACKTAKIDHFIKTLPNAYDMIISEEANISQGQRQLLTIARAMIENAPMLILDEATSSVDTRTEELIQAAMDKLTHGRTSFVIAHRLSTIKNADLILVMNEGNIVEAGNHKQLMERSGFYYDLYNSQFSLGDN